MGACAADGESEGRFAGIGTSGERPKRGFAKRQNHLSAAVPAATCVATIFV